MFGNSRRISKRTFFTSLMIVCLVMSLLPTSVTARVRAVGQPLAGFLWPINQATQNAKKALIPDDLAVSVEGYIAMQIECEELRRQLAYLNECIGELQHDLDELAGLKNELGSDRTKIWIASVIGGVSDRHREAIRVRGGTGEGIRVGQWVAAGTAEHDREGGRLLLGRQWLIGRVSEVHDFESTVTLTTDPLSGVMGVQLAKLDADGGWQRVGEKSLCRGIGDGRLLIEDATRDYWTEGAIFVLAPRSGDLPAAMTLGEVTGAARSEIGPLQYNLSVRPWGDPYSLAYVYIVITQ